ncbi:hypothetical protein [Pedobacter sp. Leaf170]|uniref:hypothetical protein n=1 Tax=Pedobacter sp. Leaf170 TaxID=2876558 RepID=UPI001E2AA418|nr:hypothetical protein [Pedobacter sp. Leaf170]
MFSNPQTGTRIIVFKSRTIVVNRIAPDKKQFRIYIDGAYKGILELTEEGWTHTPGYILPMGVFTLLTKRMGIGEWTEGQDSSANEAGAEEPEF